MRTWDRTALGWGFGLFLLGALLRAWGLGWGLPSQTHMGSYHPDELVIHLYSQQIEPAKLDFDPGFYNYGTLYLTLCRVANQVVDTYAGVPDQQDPRATQGLLRRHLLVGRVLSLLAGAAIGWLVFALLYKRTNLMGAIFGGGAALLAPGLVMHSRFQTVDVFATFLAVASLLVSSRMIPREGEGPLTPKRILQLAIWAGVLAGLSAGAKYSGIVAWVAVPFCVWGAGVGTSTDKAKATLVSLFAAIVAFLLATPGALTNSSNFLEGLRYEMAHTAEGHGIVFAGTPNGFVFHVFNLWVGFGVLLMLLGLAGLVRLARKRRAWAFGLLAFAVLTYVLIGRAEVKFVRYTFPLIPVLAVSFGFAMGQAHTHPNRRWRLLVGVGILALAGLGGGGAAGALQASVWMAEEDPRDEALSYLRNEVGAGERVGLVSDPWFYTPPLHPSYPLGPLLPWDQRVASLQESTPAAALYVPAVPAERFAWDVRLLEDLRPEFVVFSSFESDDVRRLMALAHPPEKYAIFAQRGDTFAKALDEGYERARVFGLWGPKLHDMMYVRPVIEVWKRKDLSPTPSSGSSTGSGSNETPRPTP